MGFKNFPRSNLGRNKASLINSTVFLAAHFGISSILLPQIELLLTHFHIGPVQATLVRFPDDASLIAPAISDAMQFPSVTNFVAIILLKGPLESHPHAETLQL